MKKKISGIVTTLTLLSSSANAQVFRDAANKANTEVKGIVFSILGVIFLIGVMINISKLFGENKDIKGFIINVFLFLIICLVIGGIYTAIVSLSI